MHPLQVYLGLLAAGCAAFAIWFDKRKQFPGQVFLVYVLMHAFGKGVLETLRYRYVSHLQQVAFLFAFASASILLARSFVVQKAR